MCGIIGILGNSPVQRSIIEALEKLEYRGYDSSGIATISQNEIIRRRSVGKLSCLKDILSNNPVLGKIGIGHTRWATHGAPSVDNAHPHKVGKVAVVHNGIIENYHELKLQLNSEGGVVVSETDTEVVAAFCSMFLESGISPEEAVSSTLGQLKGAYALCFIFEGNDDLIIAARKGSPLVIGWGNNEMFVGSDAIALAHLTNQLTYVEEENYVVISRKEAKFFNFDGEEQSKKKVFVNSESVLVTKSGYRHFMHKEINEQASVISYALGSYTSFDRKKILLPNQVPSFAKMERIIISACGTAFLASHVAKYWFEKISGLPADIDIASEFRYRDPIISKKTGAIFVSQSGETADTLAALRMARSNYIETIVVVNSENSTMAREADIIMPIRAGVEVGVASTKAFTAQLLVLAALVIEAARQRKKVSPEQEEEFINQLFAIPRLINEVLSRESEIINICSELANAQDILFIARGSLYPLALEGALKLKEISYIHAEGYAAGELKHGPIALIDSSVPIICFAPSNILYDKTTSNIHEVIARGGKVILVSDKKGLSEFKGDIWKSFEMPFAEPFILPILYALPAQLFAYYSAIEKGTDVDQPRNLAKSVTVE